MKKAIAMVCMTGMIFGSVCVAHADEAVLHALPSASLKTFLAGKTFEARFAGYGWGEDDDVSSLSLDFTIVEPLTYAAEEIEALTEGDSIVAGYEWYTVASVEEADGAITVVPEEEWLTPITFTAAEDGSYAAETEDGALTGDSFSFPATLSDELVYVNAEGEELTAAELLQGLVEGSVDTDTSTVILTFDENAAVAEIDFSK